jgi:hypothetical protein
MIQFYDKKELELFQSLWEHLPEHQVRDETEQGTRHYPLMCW